MDAREATKLFERLGVKLSLMIAYNPETNGKIERGHAPIVKAIVRCRDDPIARHGSRGGTAGVLDQKDSTLAQALARRDLRKNEREIETKL